MAKETVQDFYKWFKGGQEGSINIMEYLLDKLGLAGGMQSDVPFTSLVSKKVHKQYDTIADALKAKQSGESIYEEQTPIFELLYQQDTPFEEMSEDDIESFLKTSVRHESRPSNLSEGQLWYGKSKATADLLSLQEGLKELGLENMFSQLDKDVGFKERETKRKTEDILKNYIQNQQQGRYAQFTGAPRVSSRGLTKDDYMRLMTSEKSKGLRSVRDVWSDTGGELFGEVRDWLEKMT